jgi:UDP-N-acetylmuramate: L-alanyl-gamma-D-glutamyl-meso-diaminopimelate ligase
MRYHLIGICGTAMASLAGMLQARGHRVTGSDENVYPPMSTMLASLGIPVMQGYKAEHLLTEQKAKGRRQKAEGGYQGIGDRGQGPEGRRQEAEDRSGTSKFSALPDCVIIGNAIPRGNPEVEETLKRKLWYRSQAEVVKEEFIRGRRSLVVAGTHGKTTTTSIAAWVIDQGGLNPTFLIGGIAQNFGASFRVTDSDYFIIEGDEYDTAYFDKGPKFMHYLPELALVNNIEFDHADIYADLAAVKVAFRRFINTVPGNGRLIAGWDSPHVREVVGELGQKLFTQLETFGTCEDARWQARRVDYTGDMTQFQVFREGSRWGEFETPLIGEFNVRNCLAVIIAADAWGIERKAIADALATFKCVSRRCEVRGEVNGITVIDDFAHHPTAVRETLSALRLKFPDYRLIAVFEPRSWSSRLAVFQDEYVNAFAAADYVIVAGVFDTEKAGEKGRVLDTSKLIRDIAAQRKPAFAIRDVDEIVRILSSEARSGDVITLMSNGGFGGIHEKLLAALARMKDEGGRMKAEG